MTFYKQCFLFCTLCLCNRLRKGEASWGLQYYGYAYNDIWDFVVSFLVCKPKGCMLQNISTTILNRKNIDKQYFISKNDIFADILSLINTKTLDYVWYVFNRYMNWKVQQDMSIWVFEWMV